MFVKEKSEQIINEVSKVLDGQDEFVRHLVVAFDWRTCAYGRCARSWQNPVCQSTCKNGGLRVQGCSLP